jgi:type IV secretory pathway VirD2 relaxase
MSGAGDGGDEFDFPAFRPRLGRDGRRVRPMSTLQQINARARAMRGGRASKAGGGTPVPPPKWMRSRYVNRACGQRRVVVKARVHKLAGHGVRAGQAHLDYIQREGAGHDGEDGELFGPERDAEIDGPAWQRACEGDRHQFRFIVSPEDGADIAAMGERLGSVVDGGLEGYTRRLMEDVEKDLNGRDGGTGKLDWVAVEHHNTGHPHVHVVLRGKRRDGKDLVIPKGYVAHGIRQRAAERAWLELGPETEIERLEKLRADIRRDGPTRIDRIIEQRLDLDGTACPPAMPLRPEGPIRQAHVVARLEQLEGYGLAERTGNVTWRVEPDLTKRLREREAAQARQGRIDRALARRYGRALAQGTPPLQDRVVFDPLAEDAKPLTGRLIGMGLSDELLDHRYAIVEATDGRAYHVELGKLPASQLDELYEPTKAEGGVADAPRRYLARGTFTLTPADTAPQPSDLAIAKVADQRSGRWSEDTHRAIEPGASDRYLTAIKRRLEAQARNGLCRREVDGAFYVHPDYLDGVRAQKRHAAQKRPLTIERVSLYPPGKEAALDAPTYLDRIAAGDAPVPERDAGFGKEVRAAYAARLDHLERLGLLQRQADGSRLFAHGWQQTLRDRELAAIQTRLTQRLGKPHGPSPGIWVEGVYAGSVPTSQGKLAIIDRGHAFELVPWRGVLERQRGKHVTGTWSRGHDGRGDVSWEIGRDRGLER